MSLLAIPFELVEFIIDFLSDDPKTLASCSLVCSSWILRTRHWLFRSVSIHLSRPRQSKQFLNLLTHPSSTILSHIQHLAIGCGNTPTVGSTDFQPCVESKRSLTLLSEDPTMPFDLFLSTFRQLANPSGTNIHSLRLFNLDWTTFPLEKQIRISTTLSRIFPKVTSLELDHVVLHDIRQLNSTLARAFPGLVCLGAKVDFWKCDEDSVTTDHYI
ncbi:hypothetical protein EV361DRAFT_916449 [Lentinula raphanica]|uniref:F-box domain-containing protein n=1 Tax=Lentinula raphanica TaxID=153919 RepID=A0AA38UJS8_9AGAR|nr:hypothetical protein F5878DRAFT_207837 [Lentinula raphanica]KAJ3970326.1 hypothetical protein EV361DRAFT_916449 [Lentinula raphanica]